MKHKHRWQFMKIENHYKGTYMVWEKAVFICECGAVKRVKVKEEI